MTAYFNLLMLKPKLEFIELTIILLEVYRHFSSLCIKRVLPTLLNAFGVSLCLFSSLLQIILRQ